MSSRTWWRAVPVALVVALATACGAEQQDDVAATPAPEPPSWQERVLPSERVLPDATPEALATAGLLSELFADPSRDELWAQYHYADDGTRVVVNLVAGWEPVLDEELREVMATAPAPLEVREVEHSHRELMQPVFDLAPTDPAFAGAGMTSASVDPERNALVIGLTEVDENSVAAVTDAFGPDVYVREEVQGTQAPGT